MKSYNDFKNQIDEVLTKKTPLSKWIHDFVHSDDPKFAGKSKEERIKMAQGAYYGAQKESVEEACWKGYTAVGLKMKNGRKVPNCVPVKEDGSEITIGEGKMAELHASLSRHLDKHVAEYKRAGGAESLGHKSTVAAQKISKEHGIASHHAQKFVNDYIENKLKESMKEDIRAEHIREAAGHLVHVSDGSKYDETPHKKDIEHVQKGAMHHGGEWAGHSDKGAFFKFKSKSDADNFKRHVDKCPHKSCYADHVSEAVEYKGIGTDVVDKKKKLNPQPNLMSTKKTVKDFKEELDEEAAAGLAAKAKKSGVSLSILKKVYARGVAAWNSGHRPGTTPQQWGMARVNSYITKGKGTYHGADKDLREEELHESGGPVVWKKDCCHIEKYGDNAYALYVNDKKQKMYTSLADAKSASEKHLQEDSRLEKKGYHAGLSKSTAKARVAHWKKMDKLSDKNPKAYEPAPGDKTAETKPSVHTKKYHAIYGEELDQNELNLIEAMTEKDKLRQALDRHTEKAVAANKAGDHDAVKVHQGYINKIKTKMGKLAKEETETPQEYQAKKKEQLKKYDWVEKLYKNAPKDVKDKAPVKEEVDLTEDIKKEYDSLKKHDIKTLRGMIKQQHRVVDTSEFRTKEHAISHILNNKHGNKRVMAALHNESDASWAASMEKQKENRLTNKDKGTLGKIRDLMDKEKAKKEFDLKMKKAQNSQRVAKALGEEAEQIDEISKQTLGSYINKAASSAAQGAYKGGVHQSTAIAADKRGDYAGGDEAMVKSNQHFNTTSKRLKGIALATKKMNKEDIDETYRLPSDSEIDKVKSYVKSKHPNKSLAQVAVHKATKKIEYVVKDKDGKMSGHTLGEEVEQIDEISNKTLGSYVKKAKSDMIRRELGINNALRDPSSSDNAIHKATNKQLKRSMGFNKAVDKLAKEETINELSKSTLASYVQKAHKDNAMNANDLGHQLGRAKEPGHTFSSGYLKQKGKYIKRSDSIDKAVSKLAKEDTEIEESRGHKVIATFLKNREIAQRAFNKPVETPKEPEKKDKKLNKEGVSMLNFNDFLKEGKCGSMKKEELKGNQHKLDKNKNGKLDADDFKKLRGENKDCDYEEEGFVSHAQRKAVWASKNEKGVKEEVKKKDLPFDPDPKPTKKVTPGKYGQGYSQAKHLAQKGLKSLTKEDLDQFSAEDIEEFMMSEDYDQLDEISKATLASYIPKAARSARIHGQISTEYKKASERKKKPGLVNALNSLSTKYKQKAWDREANIKKAVGKLAKEDLELTMDELVEYMQTEAWTQLDELSKKTLGSYVKKASGDLASSIHYERDAEENDDKDAAGAFAHRAGNRISGLQRAGKKIAKEEVELDEVEQVSYKDMMSRIEEGKIDDYLDKKRADANTASAYSDKKKPAAKPSSVTINKGRAYGGAAQKDDEGDEKPETTEKRGRGRPTGSKSGARQKGNGHNDGGIQVHNLNLPTRNNKF